MSGNPLKDIPLCKSLFWSAIVMVHLVCYFRLEAVVSRCCECFFSCHNREN